MDQENTIADKSNSDDEIEVTATIAASTPIIDNINPNINNNYICYITPARQGQDETNLTTPPSPPTNRLHQYKTTTSLRKDRVQRRIQFAIPEIVACSPMKKRKHNNDGEPDFQFPPLPILSLPKQQENVQPQQTKKRQAPIAPNITKSSITIKPPNWMLPEHARQLKASKTPLDAAPKVTTSNFGKPPEHPSKPLPQRRTTNYYFNQIPQEERRYNARQEPIRQRTYYNSNRRPPPRVEKTRFQTGTEEQF
ncbi:unnamed protein product [Didymodactylos carnosus]|uniref:Uncharacterized protein n=1 Tax=Didymodactylos carnosus TaxID=1234261 RepID=A0A815BH25_9BILA|nr:unnamed protein product [Didymodactylos carnosus]CAF4057034.1 unnamed protein product [Didymodactylos carnosus]